MNNSESRESRTGNTGVITEGKGIKFGSER